MPFSSQHCLSSSPQAWSACWALICMVWAVLLMPASPFPSHLQVSGRNLTAVSLFSTTLLYRENQFPAHSLLHLTTFRSLWRKSFFCLRAVYFYIRWLGKSELMGSNQPRAGHWNCMAVRSLPNQTIVWFSDSMKTASTFSNPIFYPAQCLLGIQMGLNPCWCLRKYRCAKIQSIVTAYTKCLYGCHCLWLKQ